MYKNLIQIRKQLNIDVCNMLYFSEVIFKKELKMTRRFWIQKKELINLILSKKKKKKTIYGGDKDIGYYDGKFDFFNDR